MSRQAIAELIKERRKAKGLTQEKLAELTGVTLRCVQYWEKACKSISLENADKLFKALGVEVKIGGSE